MLRNRQTLPAIEELRKTFSYCPESGQITWKACANFKNTRRPGSEAGAVCISTGYRNITYKGRSIPAHCIAWAIFHGAWPEEDLDHINRQRADNRLCNLRACTSAQNAANRPPIGTNKTGYKSVWRFRNGRYVARMEICGKRVYLGYFDTPEEAHAAYVKKHREAFGEFSFYREAQA